MGEYTGRRRGRPAEEPPEPQYYGYEQPSFEQPSYEQPSYEQPSFEVPVDYGYESPSYEAYGYETHQYAEPERYAPEPQQWSPERYADSHNGEYYYEEYAEEYAEQYTEGYAEPYTEEYAEEYSDDYVEEYVEDYADGYADDYAEPRFEPRRRSEAYAPEYSPEYAPDYSYAPPAARLRQALPLTAHLPFLGASTAALVVASFVSAKAVAAVVLPLQLLVAWAILDLAGYASRRTAAFVALPALAATVGTFKFQADESATAIAGGLGAGFFLLAADAVFRAGRRGVEPGTVRAVAAAASALLFAGLTGLFLPAAALHLNSVAAGAAVCGLASLVAARNPELGGSRAAVVAIPVTIAALASYAAAILVP